MVVLGGVAVSYERGTPVLLVDATMVKPLRSSYTGPYPHNSRGAPFSGDGVKFDPREVLVRSWGDTVGRMSLLATYAKAIVAAKCPDILN